MCAHACSHFWPPTHTLVFICDDCLRQVFGDIVTMIDGDLRLYCDRAGCVVNVPTCDVLMCGYPCRSLSGLNPNDRQFSDSSSSTGGPQQAIMQYVMQRRPACLIFENVKQMLHSRAVDGDEDTHLMPTLPPAGMSDESHIVSW